MVNFKDGVSQGEGKEGIKKAAAALAKIPEAHNMVTGMAAGEAGKVRYASAMFIDFDSEAALKIYNEHPAHKAVVVQLRSFCSEFFVADYQV
jgi:hypothetical protein